MYLFQVLNRHPSTIDSYRTAIVDTLGPAGHHIPHAQTLTGYSPVFSRIIPKFQESSKVETFLLCLMSSQKHPLSHRPQTSFLSNCFLASFGLQQAPQRNPRLGCKQVFKLGQREKVTLFPSSDFLAKNQLTRDGSQSVSPVTIPALTTIVNRQFKKSRPCVRYGPRGIIWIEPKT